MLKRGDTFDQALTPSGNGTSSAWNVIGAYGTGSAPKIQRDGNASDRGIVLTNADYWSVQNLEISDAGLGILVNYTTDGHTGLDFEGLYIHDITGIFHGSPTQTDDPRIYSSAAITVDVGAAPAPPAGSSVIQDITFANSQTSNTAALYLVGGAVGESYVTLPSDSIDNVNISGIYAHTSASETFAFAPASDIHLSSSYIDCSGSEAQSQGTTCMFVFDTNNLTIADNTFVNMNDTGSHDQTAIDLEGSVNNTTISGNYFGSNAGAAIEMLALSMYGSDDYNTNTLIDSNTFSSNGNSSTGMHGDIASLAQTGTTAPSATVSNNLYNSNTYGFFTSSGSEDVTLTNNDLETTLNATTPNFPSTQGSNGWHEQYYNGTSWTDMSTFDPTANAWSNSGGGTINSIEMIPTIPTGSSNAWVSRTWVAPSTGTIHVRGQAFKGVVGGDGVEALIADNNTIVWPTTSSYYGYQTIGASDIDGYSTDVDLSVTAGDVIKFVVWSPGSSSTDDAVSWTPTIGY